MVSSGEIEIVLKYEEAPDGNDEDEFQNNIVLAKRYKSYDEPKIVNLSFEQLIEKFCQDKQYLSGQATELSITSSDGILLDKGLIIGRTLLRGKTHQLRLIRTASTGKMTINSNRQSQPMAADASYNPQEHFNPQERQSLLEPAPVGNPPAEQQPLISEPEPQQPLLQQERPQSMDVVAETGLALDAYIVIREDKSQFLQTNSTAGVVDSSNLLDQPSPPIYVNNQGENNRDADGNCTRCLQDLFARSQQTYSCSFCRALVCRVCKHRVSEYHDHFTNIFGCPKAVYQDMSRIGKVIWVLFYILIVPILAFRYSAVAIGAFIRSFRIKYLDPIDSESEIFFMGGYYGLGALLYPLVLVYCIVGGLLYQLFNYCRMIGSVCAYRKHVRHIH